MTARYLIGDVLEVLPTLEAGSVDLILTSPPFLALRSYLPQDHPDKAKEGGSQPTPGAFIDWLVDVVEALDRVLAPHGSMVIELGDTYAGGTGFQGTDDFAISKGRQYWVTDSGTGPMRDKNGSGWPADKSLTLIPELFRMTLVYGFNPLTGRQTKRWRLRNVIRWVRPNPPVGALGDKFRPATSELMVFCRTDEAGRRRFFDLDAVREAYSERFQRGIENGEKRGSLVGAPPEYAMTNFPKGMSTDHAGAPPLDWWNIPPGGYAGAHYAVFPEALCVKPIKAMCPERVCRTCGEASRRIVEVDYSEGAVRGFTSDNGTGRGGHQGIPNATRLVTAQQWSDCSHDNYRPGLVLDPFAGSGTTLAVAVGHGRDAIGIDLDERNARLAEERIGFFLEVAE